MLDPEFEEYREINTLPTLENLSYIYFNNLQLPTINDHYLPHPKEQVFFMIINLLRVKPKIFLQQLHQLKKKCEMRQKPHNLTFIAGDVQIAIDLLARMEYRPPVALDSHLCECAVDSSLAEQLLKNVKSRRLSGSNGF
jgi:hypothetical protein